MQKHFVNASSSCQENLSTKVIKILPENFMKKFYITRLSWKYMIQIKYINYIEDINELVERQNMETAQ